MEPLIYDPVLKSSVLSIVRGRWYSVCAPPVLSKIKQKFVLFWKGVQSSDSLAEEFKKTPGVCVYQYLKGTGASPLRARDNICVGLYANKSYVALQKCTKSRYSSIQRHFYTQHNPMLLSAVFV